MKYAVINYKGQQFKVAEGDVLEVALMADAKQNDAYTFEDVLLFVDGTTKEVGTPTLTGAKVTATVVENIKLPKIRVAKFKAKARYRRVYGHRTQVTKVKIDTITKK